MYKRQPSINNVNQRYFWHFSYLNAFYSALSPQMCLPALLRMATTRCSSVPGAVFAVLRFLLYFVWFSSTFCGGNNVRWREWRSARNVLHCLKEKSSAKDSVASVSVILFRWLYVDLEHQNTKAPPGRTYSFSSHACWSNNGRNTDERYLLRSTWSRQTHSEGNSHETGKLFEYSEFLV